jgi:hypothetical protein
VVVRAAALTAAALLTLGSPALAASPPGASDEPRLTEEQAVRLLLTFPKVASWLQRYPPEPTTRGSFDPERRSWTVQVWSGAAGEIAVGEVDDRSGRVLEAWTGPQVAWKMARGRSGAFGGKILNEPAVWLAFAAVFLAGLANWRRPLSLRNLDLVVLLSFSVSLAFFNRGDIFTSVPLVYPPLVYLLGRTAWIGFRGRGEASPRPVWPVWLLVAAAVFLLGFRVGLNLQAPRSVIDVGYAGVIGAHRILDGRAPYGNMPVRSGRTPCGEADSDGEIRDRIQTDGRCEAANEHGDTYGPASYLVYVPAVALLGWSGKWDSLPAAHATAIGADLLVLLGLLLVGRRFGGSRLAATLAFAWSAYPFTAYVLNANTNDAFMPAFLVWGFWLATSAPARGIFTALASWTKFAALLVVPLWATYPRASPRLLLVFGLAFATATLALFGVLLLEPDLRDAARVFWDRTLGFQLERESPFSLWDWGQYHARGIPDLHLAQLVLQAGVLVLAGVAAAVPTRKGPLELAALTGAVILAVELVLTHWFYLYLPWILPFVTLALFLPLSASARKASSAA